MFHLFKYITRKKDSHKNKFYVHSFILYVIYFT